MSILKKCNKKLKFFKSKFLPVFLRLGVSAMEGETSNLSSNCGVKKKREKEIKEKKTFEKPVLSAFLIICMKEG